MVNSGLKGLNLVLMNNVHFYVSFSAGIVDVIPALNDEKYCYFKNRHLSK